MDRVLFNVRRVSARYAAHAAKVLKRWSFTHARVDVFVAHGRVFGRHGVVYQSDIRGQLGCSRRTMSVMMRRLELRGMVQRRRSEEDRRKIVVDLTPLGRQAFSEIRTAFGDGFFTPHVDGHLLLHDYRTPVRATRARFIGLLVTLRAQFADFSTPGPYP